MIRLMCESFATGWISITQSAAVVLQVPPTTDQMESIARARAALDDRTDEEQRECLLRAIHWRARGRQEQSAIDRFIKYWIGVAILVMGEGSRVVTKIRDQLRLLYPQPH